MFLCRFSSLFILWYKNMIKCWELFLRPKAIKCWVKLLKYGRNHRLFRLFCLLFCLLITKSVKITDSYLRNTSHFVSRSSHSLEKYLTLMQRQYYYWGENAFPLITYHLHQAITCDYTSVKCNRFCSALSGVESQLASE